MFNLFKPKTVSQDHTNKTLKLSGMHCVGCANNIDLSLEDIPGVKNSNTNFQKSTVEVSYDSKITDIEKITKEIEFLGYQVKD